MLKRVAILAAVICALLIALGGIDWASSFWSPCNVHYTETQEDKRNDSYNECPFLGGIVGAGLDAIGSLKSDAWTAIATVCIAFFTLALWRSTDRLWLAGEKQIESAKVSAEAAAISAKALAIGQRAFVVCTGMEVETHRKDGVAVGWKLKPVIENTGGSATLDLRYSTGGVLGARNKEEEQLQPSPPDPDRGYRFDLEGGGFTRGVLGPGARTHLGWIDIERKWLQLIAQGEYRAYYHGSIRYRDRIEPHIERITKFCYAIRAEQMPDGDIRPACYASAHWNCTDEDCERDSADYRAALTSAYQKAGMGEPPDYFFPKKAP